MNNPAVPIGQLRFLFVGMLFAITIAEIAVQTADLVVKGPSFVLAAPAYAHLLLALIVVSTSWVGWSLSNAPGAQQDVQGVFDRTYLVLLIDVLLVFAYFILVKSVEIERPQSGGLEIQPSAAAEAKWVSVIFGGYFFWDLLTKAVFPGPASAAGFFGRLLGGALWRRGWMSFVCLLFALLTWCVVNPHQTPARVIWSDVALASIVLLFRALKDPSETKRIKVVPAFIALIVFAGSLVASAV